MKEQWKKLDSDAKLLVNVEEGRPLPIKIELPISAFVSNKDDCCKRLLTILRVFVLTVFLLLLSWIAILLFAYCVSETNIDLDKIIVNGESIYDDDDKSSFRNEIDQSMKEDRPISNGDTPDSVHKSPYHGSLADDTFIAKESLFAEEPVFIDKAKAVPSASDENGPVGESAKVNEMSKRLQDLFQAMQKMEQGWTEQIGAAAGEEQVDFVKEDSSPQELEILEKTVDEIIHDILPLNERSEGNDDNDESSRVAETSDELVGESLKKEEKTEEEIVKGLFNFINALAFDEQMSVEDASSFVRPVSSKLSSEEKPVAEEAGSNEDLPNADKVIFPSESNDGAESAEQKASLSEEPAASAEEKSADLPSAVKSVAPLKFATLLSRYLEPIVGENDEMLVWYYVNRNKPGFEKENEPMKVHTAKLLYSTNIAEYPADMEVVLNSLLLNDNFVRDLRMLLEGELKSASPEDYKPVQYRIVDRIATKLNMNKLIREDPKVIEVFSRMIETNNRLELSQSNVDLEDVFNGEIAVKPNKSLFIQSPEEAESQRLSVLEAIRKVANEDAPSVDELVPEDENEEATESEEKIRNIIDYMEKVVMEDKYKEARNFEFGKETTPDAVAIAQENESIAEKSEFASQESEEEPTFVMPVESLKNPVTTMDLLENNSDSDKSDESEVEVEKQLETLIETIRTAEEKEERNEENPNMNSFLQVYSDFYDY